MTGGQRAGRGMPGGRMTDPTPKPVTRTRRCAAISEGMRESRESQEAS